VTGSDVGSETGTGANDGKAEVMDGIGGTWDGVAGNDAGSERGREPGSDAIEGSVGKEIGSGPGGRDIGRLPTGSDDGSGPGGVGGRETGRLPIGKLPYAAEFPNETSRRRCQA